MGFSRKPTLGPTPRLPTRMHTQPPGDPGPAGGRAGGLVQSTSVPTAVLPLLPAPRKDQARLLRRGTAAESGAHPCLKCGRLEAIRGLGGACPAPCVTGLGFLEGAGHPLPAEPMPGLAAPRGREDMAVAPSLLPSEFRGYRKGPADRAQALGPLHHPPFLAQPRLPGWHLDFLPPSPPPQALTLFFFSKSFSSGAWPGKWGEESECPPVYLCVCMSVCICLAVSIFACLCVYPSMCWHVYVFRCVWDSVSTGEHLSVHL